MTLPAPAPTGLTVATFRAGLSRGIGAAAPAVRLWLGQAAPGEYRSPFPARLRAARAAVVVLALLWLAAGFYGLSATRAIVQTVGHDTAPSVSAAEVIRTGLAAANADYALAMLSSEGLDGPSLSDMRSQLQVVRTAIVDAAVNITYGQEERGPILQVLQGLGSYEELIGWSDGKTGENRRDLAFAADDLLHRTALPAAEALGKVNLDHLSEAYQVYSGRWPVWWVVAAGLLLTVALVATQVDTARTARRLVNPGLAVATLAVFATTAIVVIRLLASQADLRVAKSDAFDSIYALSSARALAADFDAGQSFALLAADDPTRQARYTEANRLLARRLLERDIGAAADAAHKSGQTPRNSGYIGDELANVTFPGEREAAEAMVRAWNSVLAADAVLMAEQARGDRAAALAEKTSFRADNARSALERFDAALSKVRAINQDAFASSIASAEGDDAPLGVALVVGFVLAVAASWFGIGRRLDEYRF